MPAPLEISITAEEDRTPKEVVLQKLVKLIKTAWKGNNSSSHFKHLGNELHSLQNSSSRHSLNLYHVHHLVYSKGLPCCVERVVLQKLSQTPNTELYCAYLNTTDSVSPFFCNITRSGCVAKKLQSTTYGVETHILPNHISRSQLLYHSQMKPRLLHPPQSQFQFRQHTLN